MVRGSVACLTALALCSNSTAIRAEPPTKDTQIFNEPLERMACVSTPPSGQNYPFSVPSILRSLSILPRPEQVKVLVVDNNFIGYRLNDDDENQPDRVSSKNFPVIFFKTRGEGDFAPWIDDDLRAERPSDSDPLMSRHGTHVAGIILGGMYDNRTPPTEGANLRQPSARRLLLFDPDEAIQRSKEKSWLRIAFLSLRYGIGEAGDDPVIKLNGVANRISDEKIINMSLGRILTSGVSPTPLNERLTALIVTSAGNNRKKLVRGEAVPATLTDTAGRILVVASHDANGQLSEFSNYGEHVSIAAPGCQIKSWIDGEKDAVPLSGTSMATAIVTFGAALVRSRWAPPLAGPALRNRILASSRYSADLRKCSKVDPNSRADSNVCVKDGAMLDIEAAVLVTRDQLEYEDCADAAAQDCVIKRAVGELVLAPSFIKDCIGEIHPKLLHGGMTLNGAIKRTEDPNSVMVAYETGTEVGEAPLVTKMCSRPANDDHLIVKFKEYRDQPDGGVVVDEAMPRSFSRVIRIVTRVEKPAR